MDPYKAAGVDINKANDFISSISDRVKETHTSNVLSTLTGFSGLFALGSKYKDPVLVSGTDGVGTKLMVAEAAGVHNTIGIDLVAMCVNDVVVTGAVPLFFLDYFATGALEPDVAAAVLEGIVQGCKEAECSLIGGETAEMPGMYKPGSYDLAGFSVGAVERNEVIDGHNVTVGDVMVGLSSTGLHSNGFSLVREIVKGVDLSTFVPGVGELGTALLTPTRIYVKVLKALNKIAKIKSISHITGGGFYDNIHRTLPNTVTVDALSALLDTPPHLVQDLLWDVPPIFSYLQEEGDMPVRDMLRVFNCGIGMTVVIPAADVHAVMSVADTFGCNPTVLGNIIKK